jgi:hypothetical protein
MGTDKQRDGQTEMGKIQYRVLRIWAITYRINQKIYLNTSKYLLIYTPTVIPCSQTNKQMDGHGQADKYLLNIQG